MSRSNKNNTYAHKSRKMAQLKQNNAKQSESILMRVVEKQNTRTRQDVGRWRTALKAAENVERPRRKQLYDLYDDLVLDTHMSSLMQTRIQRILSMPFRVVNKTTRDEDEEKTNLLQRHWFYKSIELAMDSLFWGHSLIETQDLNDDKEISDVKLVPRRHVIPEWGIYIVEDSDDTGIDYRNSALIDNLIEVGEDKDLGLLNKAAPWLIFKKNVIAAWAEYCEIFGMPMRVGKTNTRNSKDFDRMDDALKKMAQGAYAVMDITEDINFVESTKGDAFNVYDKLIIRVDSQLSKMVVGQTMTTDVGENGSRAAAEVHAEQGDYIFASDLRRVDHIINYQIFKVLKNNGHNWDGFEFEWNETEIISKDEFEMDMGLFEKFDIEIDYFKNKYNVPIIGLKKSDPEKPINDPESKKEQERQGKKEVTKKVTEKKKLRLTQQIEQLYGTEYITLAGGDDIDLGYVEWMGTIESFLQSIHSGKVTPEDLNEELFWYTAKQMQAATQKGDRKGFIEVDFSTPDYNYRSQIRRSLFAFAGAKSYQHLAELNAMLLDEKGKTVPFSVFKNNVAEYRKEALNINTKYNSTWLQAEYDTALNQSQANRRWQDILNNADIFPNVEYSTVGDSKVAEPCIHLNGVVQPVNSSWVATYSPQNHFRCRCKLNSTDKPVTSNPPTPSVPPGFSGNAFDLGYIITPQHPYFGMAKETLNKVTGRTNQLVSNTHIANQRKSYTELSSDYNKIKFADGTGGYHAAHKKAQALNADELAVVEQMLKEGHAVIRPEYNKGNYQKNYDAEINGARFDFKTTEVSTKASIEALLKGAKGQANSVVLYFKGALKTNELVRALYNKLQKNSTINAVLIVRNNKTVVITKTDVANRKVEALIKTIAD